MTGRLNPGFAALFLLLAVLYGLLLSQIAVEAFLLQRYRRASDRVVLLAASLLEFAGFRQLLALERSVATLRPRRPGWGQMRRVGIPAGEGLVR